MDRQTARRRSGMNRARCRWILATVALLWLLEPSVSRASEGEVPHESTPTEGEVGTRATPMLKQGLQSPFGNKIPEMSGVMATLPPSPYPPACLMARSSERSAFSSGMIAASKISRRSSNNMLVLVKAAGLPSNLNPTVLPWARAVR